MADSYSTAKSKHVQNEMNQGKSRDQARWSWSHGNNCPMKKWQANNSTVDLNGYTPPGPEWEDYAHTSDDL